MTPLWDNPFILLDGKPIHNNKFASLGQKLTYIYEFFDPTTGARKSRLEINRKYKTKLTQEKFTQISVSLDQALIGVGLQKNCPFEYQTPIRPALLEIANQTEKGSKSFYNLIRAKKCIENKIHLREQKWHQSLGCTYSVQTWRERYQRCQKIKYDNRLKWLVYQVTR